MSGRGPIGIFDSGVGGLSILREIRTRLPNEDLLYFADQAHVPYGPRPLEHVQHYAHAITAFLLERDVKLVVVACNTASAAALYTLRAAYPSTRFVGMEPAVKPAVKTTRSRGVGVLATPATFQGALYASVVERFAQGVVVHNQTLPGLVERIEAGDLDGPQTRAILERGLQSLRARGVDTLVLACTHYPFIIPTLRDLVDPSVEIIDPSPAIARQAQRLLDELALMSPVGTPGKSRYFTSADPAQLDLAIRRLLGEDSQSHAARWHEDRLIAAGPPAD